MFKLARVSDGKNVKKESNDIEDMSRCLRMRDYYLMPYL